VIGRPLCSGTSAIETDFERFHQAGKILESGEGGAPCAERPMIETSMQLTISSRRDIAVLQKESSAIEGEEDVK
jgi:hypothetical protein